ncbi:hypothetical protein TNCV_3052971 [Trichonephila clavipes]|nr:hypothetical protein TNCV_3052971 [Trichonephila clavipes]
MADFASCESLLAEFSVSHEEFLTLGVKIEAVLNSRPISPLSNDPNDVETLTPAHFLVGSSLVAVPDPDYTEIPHEQIKPMAVGTKDEPTFFGANGLQNI